MKWSAMPRIELTPAWIGTIIAVVSVLLSLGATWALFSYRMDVVEAKSNATADILAIHVVSLAGIEQNLEWICGSLERIEGNTVSRNSCAAYREGLSNAN